MWQRWTLNLRLEATTSRPLFRYAFIERAGRCLSRRQADLLAWGFGPGEIRLLVQGEARSLAGGRKALKCGTLRALHGRHPDATLRMRSEEICDPHPSVTWAHLAPTEARLRGPLTSPWSSHRDLLSLRFARFFDAAPLRQQIDPLRAHLDCGGGPLPQGGAPPPDRHEDLGLLLRISAAILGVLPADRRCFRLFVHLARARGWASRCVARALTLTPRRIRQLAAAPEPRLNLALLALADPRLAVVP